MWQREVEREIGVTEREKGGREEGGEGGRERVKKIERVKLIESVTER